MNIMTEADFRRRITSAPTVGYFFYGEEDYLKEHCLTAAKKAVCPDRSLEFFNCVHLDGTNLTPAALSDAITALPMMSEQKLVYVHGLTFPKKTAALNESYFEVLETLNEYDYTMLILNFPDGFIDAGDPARNRPSPLFTRLSKVLTPVVFDRSTPAKLKAWIVRHFAVNGVKAEPELALRLIEACGTNMYTLSGETDKLSYYVLAHGRTELSGNDIDIVASPVFEYGAFNFANAISSGNSVYALKILDDMKTKKLPPEFVLSSVSKTFNDMLAVKTMSEGGFFADDIASVLKLNSYVVTLYMRAVSKVPGEKLREAVKLCAEADLSVKLSSLGYISIERLICAVAG